MNPSAIFQWDTVREIGFHVLQYQAKLVPGKKCTIDLQSGKTIRVWRAEEGQQYFCHGLTFGGKDAPGGAVSPYSGQSVETILHEFFQSVPETQAQVEDILVWRGIAPDSTPHSALLKGPLLTSGKNNLQEMSKVRSKNGLLPEATMTLADLILIYGESYNVYRRR